MDGGTSANITYNALGQIAQNKTSSTHYNPAGERIWAGSYNIVPWGDVPLVKYGSGANFVHFNALQSSTYTTDQAGVVRQDQILYPWGQSWKAYVTGTLVDGSFATIEPLVAASGEQTGTTLNRNYSETYGRWLSPDPFGGDVTNPQSLNRYAYVLNNPTTLTDPSGLAPPVMEQYADYVRTCSPNPTCMYALSQHIINNAFLGVDMEAMMDSAIIMGIPVTSTESSGTTTITYVGHIFRYASSSGVVDPDGTLEPDVSVTSDLSLEILGEIITETGAPFDTSGPTIAGAAGTIATLVGTGSYWNLADQLVNRHHPGMITFRQAFNTFCSAHTLVDSSTLKVSDQSHVDTVNPVPLTPLLWGPLGFGAWAITIPAHYWADVKGNLPSQQVCP